MGGGVIGMVASASGGAVGKISSERSITEDFVDAFG